MHQYNSSELMQRGVFRNFTHDTQSNLAKMGRIISVRDKDTLYNTGDNPLGIYGIISGCIKLTAEDIKGNYYLYGVKQPGWWFGEISALDGQPHGQTASAMTDTKLLLIPRDRLIQTLEKKPILYKYFVDILCLRLRGAGQSMEDSAFLDLPLRLAKLLLQIHSDRNNYHAKISQEELAASLGVTRQSIYRVLKSWQEGNYISISYGDIKILEPTYLQELAL
ncbi:hypothetical protein A9Q81_17825 [Gammaproteobacteria bacterium 42_54_T18]|nr:hypothetical protein A9Q81_17825 [Gammaproteobacteria bacterium 42_54_T18]